MTDEERVPLDQWCFALVRTELNPCGDRKWIKFRAPSLEEAQKLALLQPGVMQVYEVAWDPGYVT